MSISLNLAALMTFREIDIKTLCWMFREIDIKTSCWTFKDIDIKPHAGCLGI